MIYFTSDTHLNHDKEFIWGPRGFKSINEMNETLLQNWNDTISPDDDVYMLGDFFLGTDWEFIGDAISILHGKIHLIRGNHDTDTKMNLYRNHPNIKLTADAYWFKWNNMRFYLSHYPTFTANYDDVPGTIVYNLHGHTHSKQKFYEGRPYMYNVGVDAQGNKPVSIEQIVYDIKAESQRGEF